MNKEWYKTSKKDILKILNTSDFGIESKELEKRKEMYGINILPKEKRDSLFKLFLNGFKDPIVIVLIFTIFFTIITKEFVDACVITFIILIDLLIGAIEEKKAIKSSEALSRMLKIRVRVIRDGIEGVIDAEDLVVGDIMLLASGDKISADARIIQSYNLVTDESTLTGESSGVSKNSLIIKSNKNVQDRKNCVYAGTSVMSGRCVCIVTEVGINTELGKIAMSVSILEETKSPLTIRINEFSSKITKIILGIAVVISILLFLKGMPTGEIFLSVIALSISAIPEGLPLALTMALTISSNRMAKKGVIVKKLKSVEALGSCTVIASDKTGTLTKNEQTAKVIMLPNSKMFEISGSGYNDEGEILNCDDLSKKKIELLSMHGLVNNEAHLERKENIWNYSGDSIDVAFLALAKKLKVNNEKIEILQRIPYESENQYSVVFYQDGKDIYCTIKGSAEAVCKFVENKNILTQNKILAEKGYRVIAVASGKIEYKKIYEKKDIKNLKFEGLIGFIDPLREESFKSIKECKKSGIKVLMITGDHPLTAYAIGKELGIAKTYDEVITGDEINSVPKEKLLSIVRNKKIFARITPLNKLEIVSAFKELGEFVAVTGDGVNDAPAIKAAHIGIAMGSGTDVAKDTAQMIITNDNFSSIVEGVKEGRGAYSNIRKIICMLISCGIAEVLIFLLSVFCNLPIPLIAIQLLWLNILTDGLQDIALSFEPVESVIMKRKPKSTKEQLFNKSLVTNIIVSSLAIGIIVFIVWGYLINILNVDVSIARGYIMALMVFIQNMHVINCRSETESCLKYESKNIFVVLSISIAIILQIILMESPIISNYFGTSSIPLNDLLILFFISLLIIVIMEIYKFIKRNKKIL